MCTVVVIRAGSASRNMVGLHFYTILEVSQDYVSILDRFNKKVFILFLKYEWGDPKK